MQQPIEQRGHGGGIAEELAPILDGPVRSDERRGALVAAHDDLEEVFGRGVGQPLHPEIVDDQERDGGDLREEWLARPGELGVGELVDEGVRLAVEDAMAVLDDRDADRLGEMTLAGAGRNSHILHSFSVPSSSTTPGTRSSVSA